MPSITALKDEQIDALNKELSHSNNGAPLSKCFAQVRDYYVEYGICIYIYILLLSPTIQVQVHNPNKIFSFHLILLFFRVHSEQHDTYNSQ